MNTDTIESGHSRSLSNNVSVALEFADGTDLDGVAISRFRVDSGVCRPTEIILELVTEREGALAPRRMIGSAVRVHIDDGNGRTTTQAGLVAGMVDVMDPNGKLYRYEMRVLPRMARLAMRSRLHVFADSSVPEAIRQTLSDAGFKEGIGFEFRLTSDYPPRPYLVRYRETDLQFISRLCEHWGISYFFDGDDKVIFADANNRWESGLEGVSSTDGGEDETQVVDFRATGLKDGLFEVEEQITPLPARYILRDYNYLLPKVGLEKVLNFEGAGQVVDGSELVEYGANFRDEKELELLARVRADRLLCRSAQCVGKSSLPILTTGAVFKVTGHPDWEGAKFVISEWTAEAVLTTGFSGPVDRPQYEASFVATPYEIDFRPTRVTEAPRIDGVLHGVIEPQLAPEDAGSESALDSHAQAGPADRLYGAVDQFGCYRVRLLTDRDEHQGGHALPGVRLMQPSGGRGYGMHFPLRVGTEVMLAFIEGDPDRPIITGTAPNPLDRTPVDQRNRTGNVLQSESGNFLDMNDEKGAERIKVNTPFSNSSLHLGNEKSWEQGVVMNTSGSVDTSCNFVNGISAPIKDVAALIEKKHSRVNKNRATDPKITPAMLAAKKLDAAIEVFVNVGANGYKLYQDYKKWDDWANDGRISDLERLRRNLFGTDPRSRATCMEALAEQLVEEWTVQQSGEGVYAALTADGTLALVDMSVDEMSEAQRAALQSLRDQFADQPVWLVLRWKLALKRLKAAEDAYIGCCKHYCEAARYGEQVAQHRAAESLEQASSAMDRSLEAFEVATTELHEKMQATISDARWKELRESRQLAYRWDSGSPRNKLILQVRDGKKATVATRDVPGERDLIFSKDYETKKLGGHSAYVAALKTACKTSRERTIREANAKKSESAAALQETVNTVETTDKLYATYENVAKTAKTIKDARKTFARISDIKAMMTAGEVHADLVGENIMHRAAWGTVLGENAVGAHVIKDDEGEPRAYDAGIGASSSEKGSPADPLSLFNLEDYVYHIGSDTVTNIGADKRMFLHAPQTVIAAMPAVKTEKASNVASLTTSAFGDRGGSLTLLGNECAQLASKRVVEIYSQQNALVSSRVFDVDAKAKSVITVGDHGKDPKKTTLRIDKEGVTLTVTDPEAKVRIVAEKSAVDVVAESASVKAEKDISLDAGNISLKARESIFIDAENIQMTAKSAARIDADKLALVAANDASIAAAGNGMSIGSKQLDLFADAIDAKSGAKVVDATAKIEPKKMEK